MLKINIVVQVYAMSSEDMDSITLGAPRLVRNLMAPANAKLPINEYDHDKVLSSFYHVAFTCCSDILHVMMQSAILYLWSCSSWEMYYLVIVRAMNIGQSHYISEC